MQKQCNILHISMPICACISPEFWERRVRNGSIATNRSPAQKNLKSRQVCRLRTSHTAITYSGIYNEIVNKLSLTASYVIVASYDGMQRESQQLFHASSSNYVGRLGSWQSVAHTAYMYLPFWSAMSASLLLTGSRTQPTQSVHLIRSVKLHYSIYSTSSCTRNRIHCHTHAGAHLNAVIGFIRRRESTSIDACVYMRVWFCIHGLRSVWFCIHVLRSYVIYL